MIVISIHAPREGGDNSSTISIVNSRLFQSTPPARGATTQHFMLTEIAKISIHAPREGGDMRRSSLSSCTLISIHAPREGGDSKDAQFYL